MNIAEKVPVRFATAAAIVVIVCAGLAKVRSADRTMVVTPRPAVAVGKPPHEVPAVAQAPGIDQPRTRIAVIVVEAGMADETAIAHTRALSAELDGARFRLIKPDGHEFAWIVGFTDPLGDNPAGFGHAVGADLVLYGALYSDRVMLKLYDVRLATVVGTVYVPGRSDRSVTNRWASEALAKLLPDPAHCDAGPLRAEADRAATAGDRVSALSAFDLALLCKPDRDVVELAFINACALGNSEHANRFWKQLSPERQRPLLQVCVRNGGTEHVLDAP